MIFLLFSIAKSQNELIFFLLTRFSNLHFDIYKKFAKSSILGSEQLLQQHLFSPRTELYIATSLETQERANKTDTTAVHIKLSLLVCLAFTFYHIITFYPLYRGIFYDCASGLLRYNEGFVKSGFVKQWFCSIHFSVILASLKKIVRYTEEFVLQEVR